MTTLACARSGQETARSAYSKCFTANREVVDSAEGYAAVSGAIAAVKSQPGWDESRPGVRWSNLKAAISEALRTVAQERARRLKGEKHLSLIECEALVAQLPANPDLAPAYAAAKAKAAEVAMEAARGKMVRCRCQWLAEDERCSAYFFRLEKARRAPPGELAILGEHGNEVRSRTKVARAVRQV